MVAAIVLAAGESGRMGTPKALLRIGGKSFIRHIVDVLNSSEVEKVVVVLGANAEEIKRELAGLDVTVVINQDYSAGQLSSLVKGIETVEPFSPDGILLHPVDNPMVSAEVFDALVGKFYETSCLIALPTFKGKRGHPVLFSAKLFGELKKAPPDMGARSVVWSHAAEVVEVETKDEGIICDIDTREDYENLQRNLHSAS
ncbi:MAG: nucleotidyltransferase family protein [Ignavibacteria bacterium]|nr:nucleotidyltransferase family protein [Ignavibacteria bacterium]